MLRPVLLSLLLIGPAWPALSQTGAVSASEGAGPGVGAEASPFAAAPGTMRVSEPLAGVGGISAVRADDGVPYLPLQDLCGAADASAVDVTRAYADCIAAETGAYDRIAAGLPGYEPGLLASCEAATRASGSGYLSLLACLEPGSD